MYGHQALLPDILHEQRHRRCWLCDNSRFVLECRSLGTESRMAYQVRARDRLVVVSLVVVVLAGAVRVVEAPVEIQVQVVMDSHNLSLVASTGWAPEQP